MGTKIQYAINPLAASPNNNFDVNWLCDWDNFLNKGLKVNLERAALNKLQNSTDRMLEQHNIESIKKTMLMHEDIFKHQVQELHRLYSVQKMLMNEMKNGVKQSRSCGPMTGSEINYSHFSNQHQPTTTSVFTSNVESVRESQRSREPSGSCSGEPSRMLKAFDLEKPAEEVVSIKFSAMEEDQAGPSSHMQHPNSNTMNINESNEGSDIELTLSIGGSFARKRSNSHQHHHVSPELGCSSLNGNKFGELGSSGSIRTDREEECSVPNTNLGTTLNQQSKRPHWLFQDLSLNRT